MGGVQRSAKFAKYLPLFGWQPTVITVRPIAYWAQDDTLLRDLEHVHVHTTESWDPQRVLARCKKQQVVNLSSRSGQKSISQRVLEQTVAFFFVPDLKILWRGPVVNAVRQLLQHERFDALYSTSPPHSTHLIGRKLAARHRLVWVADFRDSWAQGVVVHEPTFLHRRLHRYLQDKVVTAADAVLAASQGIARQLAGNHPKQQQKIHVLPNGFDPEDFPEPSSPDDYFTFCHCGSITRFSEPTVLLQALLIIKQQHPHIYHRLRVKYIGLDTTSAMARQVKELGLEQVVHCYGYLDHRQALQHLVNSQALILIAMGKKDAHFIPGKTYEYFGSAKPILAISNVTDTIELLQQSRVALLCKPGDADDCAQKMIRLAQGCSSEMKADGVFLDSFNRKRQTEQLASLLNGLCA